MNLYVEKMPACWTPEVAGAAWAHAMEVYPNESLGYIAGGQYHKLVNIAANPQEHGRVADADTLLVMQSDAYVHSHPDGWQCPSEQDMYTQRQMDKLWIVLPVAKSGPMGTAFCFGNKDEWQVPLEGRPFRHGIFDCVSLLSDWHRQTWGVIWDHPPRNWEWWYQGRDMYQEYFEPSGFSILPPGQPLKKGDVLFYVLPRQTLVTHAAIYLDDGTILHHLAGAREYDTTRRSTVDLRSRWHRYMKMAVRHKDAA